MEQLLSVMLTTLAGTWFVVSTNFPMWTKGTKKEPAFHYTIEQRKGETVLDDKVTYRKNNKEKSISGIDRQDPENPNAFTWRGKGLLKIARSKWEVRLMDEDKQWAVIYFTKTLFTPEGVDVISRDRAISAETLVVIKKRMEADPVLKNHVSELKDLSAE